MKEKGRIQNKEKVKKYRKNQKVLYQENRGQLKKWTLK